MLGRGLHLWLSSNPSHYRDTRSLTSYATAGIPGGIFFYSKGVEVPTEDHMTISSQIKAYFCHHKMPKFSFLNFWAAHQHIPTVWQRKQIFFFKLSRALAFSSLKCGCWTRLPLMSHLIPPLKPLNQALFFQVFRETPWYGNKSSQRKGRR